MSKKIVAVIPAFNQVQDTVKCINSLYKSTYKLSEIIVIDDGSTDNTTKIIGKTFPTVKIFQTKKTSWWSGAINLGIKKAKKLNPDFLLLMNQDNQLDKNALNKLVAKSSLSKNSIVCCVVVDSEDKKTVGFCGGKFEWSFRMWRMFHYKLGNFPQQLESEAMTGMGTLIPWSIIGKLKSLDDKSFPQYYGDSDFALRAKKQGFKIFIEPTAIVYNEVNSTGLKKINRSWGSFSYFKRFWDIRSHVDIKTVALFYKKHCPHKNYNYRLLLFYLSYCGFSILPEKVTNKLVATLLPEN